MYARLKNLVVTSSLVSATLMCSAVVMTQHLASPTMASASAAAAGSVHASGCKRDQVDACKPGGCCIVN
ncbi:MAG TPA: hypothetical protein VGN35_00320 [Jatrophihabitantaceae bacterium]|jgi:hypothetical protein|nr:hypothetical protein [Jatrophihabitantaceae bacterium]